MSRHRNVQKISYEDELDDYDDYYGRSFDEEPVSMSPSTSQYIRRTRLSSSNNYNQGHKLADFIIEEKTVENDVVDDGDMFQMDDVVEPAIPISKPLPPTVYSKPIVVSIPAASTPPKTQPTSLDTNFDLEGDKPKLPNISNLRISEKGRSNSKSPSRKRDGAKTPQQQIQNLGSLPLNSSSTRLSQLAAISSATSTPRKTRKRPEGEKELINLVVVGHVDAGKSTLMGHLLYQIGCVDQRTIHKYKTESARSGKSSFAFAWVLDETEEERARGVTMDIAKTSFETKTKRVLLLDAPGHKDFIPNMITGASQADAAILVVNATTGEFETGFENGGQTREHAMLLRSLGVSQLVVAVNKLDTVDWSENRFREVENVIGTFLSKQAGFPKVRFVPVSGLGGDNLISSPNADHPLKKWYSGPPLIDFIDSFSAPPRAADGPLRIVVNDVFKATTTQLSLSGKIESGEVEKDDKVFIMPNADAAVVKGCSNDDGGAPDYCGAGDQALLTLNGTFEPDTIHAGHVIVRGGEDTLIPGKRFQVRLVVFDILVPLMKGTKAELYCHSLCVPCTLVKLVSSINKANGNVLKQRPRCLARNMSGIVEIATENDVAIEPYTQCKALGRITLRASGQTLAAGIVEKRTG